MRLMPAPRTERLKDMFATIPSVINIPLELAAIASLLIFVLGFAVSEWLSIKALEHEIKKRKEAREATARIDKALSKLKGVVERNNWQAIRKDEQKRGIRKWMPFSRSFWCKS